MPEIRDDYGSLLTEQVDEARLAGNLHSIRRRQAEHKVRRARVVGSGVTALVCAALALFYVRSAAAPGSPVQIAAREEARCLASRSEPCDRPTISFSDGSRVTRGHHAGLQLLENDGQRVHSVLHQGWARFSVKPGGPRRWLVDVGPLQIEVIGTAFTVSHAGGSVRVRVHHGRVQVRGEQVPGGSITLGAGESFTLAAPVAETRPEPLRSLASAPAPAPATAVAPLPPARLPARPRVVVRAPDEPLPAEPPAQPASSDAAQLALVEADRLRAAGDTSGAHALLERALAADPRGPHAGLTGFTLAQLSLNALRQPARAARELAEALASGSLSRSLHEQALAQRVEALARAGLTDEAQKARAHYLNAYPGGRWVDEMVRWSPTK